jgi:Sap, sulfolipid-1-addressing protein
LVARVLQRPTANSRIRPLGTSAFAAPPPSRGRDAPTGELRVGQVFVFSLTAALNPTLLTAVTVMLTLEKPERLLLGYLIGAAVTSVTCGLLLVFALPGSSTSSTAKHSVNPVLNIALGALILVIVFVAGTGRDRRPPRLERAQTRTRQGQAASPVAAAN